MTIPLGSGSIREEAKMRGFGRWTAVLATVGVLAGCGEPADEAAVEEPVVADDTAGLVETEMPDAPAAGGALIDPNDASEEELRGAGLDSATVAALVAGRPYETMLEADQVLAASMDETEREQVYEQVWHPLDLNTASDEEILLIPDLGDRMLREFKEYRPYRGIEEFRREIGKYVDDAEVERLERYVTIR